MNASDFDVILEDCLRQMAEGHGAEQCLAQYPQHAAALRPLLHAAGGFRAAQAVAAPRDFKAKTRARLMAHAEARARRTSIWFQPARQLALAVTLLMFVMLVSTTAFAQRALPGERLYSWKLQSERVWWVVANDRVGVDLSLVERRATELTRVAGNPNLQAQATSELHEVLDRLEKEASDEHGPKIEQALQAQQNKLLQAGIRDEKLDDAVHGKGKK